MLFATHASRTLAPAETPVSVGEAKDHLRVDAADEDALIARLIAAATAHFDGWAGVLGRALVTQTWAATYPRLASPLALPLAPVASVASVTYADATGATQTLAADQWRLIGRADVAVIEVAEGVTWPQTAERSDAVTVTFTAGYGGASDVPEALRHAILMAVHDLYDHRGEAVIGGGVRRVPLGVEALAAPYRRASF